MRSDVAEVPHEPDFKEGHNPSKQHDHSKYKSERVSPAISSAGKISLYLYLFHCVGCQANLRHRRHRRHFPSKEAEGGKVPIQPYAPTCMPPHLRCWAMIWLTCVSRAPRRSLTRLPSLPDSMISANLNCLASRPIWCCPALHRRVFLS